MHTLVHVASRGKCSVFPNCFLPYFYLFFKHVLIVYVMGMHVPWHTRVRYGLEDNSQEWVLSFQLVGPKDRTQATIHTYSFKKYLFMCVCGSMRVLQCVGGGQRTTWVSWFSFHYEIQKSVSGYQVWQQVPLICWAILICLAPPTPWVRRIKLRSSCLQGKYKLSHLSRPCVFLSVDLLSSKSILLSHSRLMAPQ